MTQFWFDSTLGKAYAILISCLLLCLPVRLGGQVAMGSISGNVSDLSNASVPNAMVQLKNEATGVSRQTTSDNSGYFSFTNLLPAVYELTVSGTGFKGSVRKGLQLQVNQGLRVDVQLELGDVVETVQVAAEAPLLESVNAKVGTVVETKQVTDLPLNGRQFAQLILLTPGALPIALGQSQLFKVQLGAGSYSPVINGQRSRYNSFILDGVENNDPMFNSYSMNPSVDAIQEFSVQSRGNVSEQGRAMGSDVVVVTRSGTNEYHGNVWEFLRNTKLDARNFFDPQRPDFKQNQFGGTFGGPVRLPHYQGRQRTFFFGYYEGFRLVRSANNITTVPTQAMRDGDFSDPGLPRLYDINTTRTDSSVPGGYARGLFAGNRIESSRINKNAQSILQEVYPLPNLPGISRNYINTTPRTVQNDQASTRIDHKISNSNNLFGRISYNNGFDSTPGGIPAVASVTTNTAWNATLSDSHIFRPNLIGHLQFGFNRYTSNRSDNPLPDSILRATGWDKVYPTGPPDLLRLGLGIADVASAGGTFIPIGPHTSYQAISDLTWIRGKHTVKLGFTWNYLDSFQVSPQASINFGRRPTSDLRDLNATGYGVASFLLGLPTDSRRAAGDTSAILSNNEYHGFIQDEVRLGSRLTVTAGVRYSYVQAMKEARDAYSGLDYLTGNYLLAIKNPITGAPPNLRERFVDPDWNNFAPRLGLAYLLNKETTIRAGVGIYYSFTDFPQVFGAPAGNWPFGLSESVGPLNDFFIDASLVNPFASSPGAALPPSPEGQGGYSIDPRQRTPYATQWNFSVQRQLPKQMLLDLTYVGSNSVKMRQSPTVNQAIPGPGPVQDRRIWPKYSAMTLETTGPPSSYNGLSVKLQKRFSSGLSFLTTYTWAHTLDVFSTERSGAQGGPQDPQNWRPDHASSLADVKHAFLLSNVYQLPFGRNKKYLQSGLVSRILGNWEWSNILGLYSGQPINFTLGFDNASLGRAGGQRPDVIGNPTLSSPTRLRYFNTSAFAVPAQFKFGNAGRDLIRGPGLYNYDTALAKDIPFMEQKNLQFRAELFNAFNLVNFGSPDTVFNSQTFGVITTARPSRSIQFSLKLSF